MCALFFTFLFSYILPSPHFLIYLCFLIEASLSPAFHFFFFVFSLSSSKHFSNRNAFWRISRLLLDGCIVPVCYCQVKHVGKLTKSLSEVRDSDTKSVPPSFPSPLPPLRLVNSKSSSIGPSINI